MLGKKTRTATKGIFLSFILSLLFVFVIPKVVVAFVASVAVPKNLSVKPVAVIFSVDGLQDNNAFFLDDLVQCLRYLKNLNNELYLLLY